MRLGPEAEKKVEKSVPPGKQQERLRVTAGRADTEKKKRGHQHRRGRNEWSDGVFEKGKLMLGHNNKK